MTIKGTYMTWNDTDPLVLQYKVTSSLDSGDFRCTNLTRLHSNCIHRGLPTYNLVHWIVLEIFSCGWRL